MTPSSLAENSSSWTLEPGDPTITGWAIAIGYMLVAVICLRAYILTPTDSDRASKAVSPSRINTEIIWLFLSIGLFFLGFNKQLDLQTLFTELLRLHAHSYGWFENRRTLQVGFIFLIGLSSLVTCIFILTKIRNSAPGVLLAFVGIVFLTGYVVARAASFHHFDIALSLKFHGITLLSFVEPLGLLIILCSALRFIFYTRKLEAG